MWSPWNQASDFTGTRQGKAFRYSSHRPLIWHLRERLSSLLCTCSCTRGLFLGVKPLCVFSRWCRGERPLWFQAKPVVLRPALWCKLRNPPIINVDALEVPGDCVCLCLRGCSSRFLCIDLLMQVQVDTVIRVQERVVFTLQVNISGFFFFTTLCSKDKNMKRLCFLKKNKKQNFCCSW